MNYNKVMLISRHHTDVSNPIYNAYIRGIESQCKELIFVDYFDKIWEDGKDNFEENILNTLEKEEIELVFFIFVSGDATLDPHFIQKVSKNRFIAMVFWDMEQFFDQIDRYYAQLADLVLLTTNHEYEYKLKLLNINTYCPFSLFDSTKYKPLQNTLPPIDVSFVGEVTKGKRKEYIKYLEDNGINIEAYGVGTKNGKVSFNKVVEIFNQSKINLSFTGTYANDIYSFGLNINNHILQNKGKPIEIALCGGFVLTEYVPSIEKVFPNEDMDTFLTKEELLQKVQYYLQEEAKRQEMATRAHEYALIHYDSINSFEKIFEQIKEIEPKKEKELYLDNIFVKIHTTFHLFRAILFFTNKKYKHMFTELKYLMKGKRVLLKDSYNFVKYMLALWIKGLSFKKDCNAIFSKLRNRDIVIYGAGIHTSSLLEKFPILQELNIRAISDKNEELWGQKLNNITIISPNEIEKYGNTIIISSFKFENEISKELQALYKEKVEIINLYNEKHSIDLTSKYIDAYQIYRETLEAR